MLVVLLAVLWFPAVMRADSTLLGTVAFDDKGCDPFYNYPNGVGVGIAFDGTNLWYSCMGSQYDLRRADPATGQVTATYQIAGGLGALVYDAQRNAIWAGWGTFYSQDFGNIYLIQLNADKTVKNSKRVFNAAAAVVNSPNPNFQACPFIDDGLAYDPADDTLYISGDCDTTIHHYDTSGQLLDERPWAAGINPPCQNSGLAVAGPLIFQASQTCNLIYVTDKVTYQLLATFSSQTGERDEDLEIDLTSFSGQGAFWIKPEQDLKVLAVQIPPDLVALIKASTGGTPPPVTDTGPRMTGGGSVFTKNGNRVTHGFELHCNPADLPNNLEVNWLGGNNFHLEKLTSVQCLDTALVQKPPAADFDTYIGVGTGRYNGVPGATARWTFTDAGEPGSKDSATIVITDSQGRQVLSVSGNLTKGNQQAHKN